MTARRLGPLALVLLLLAVAAAGAEVPLLDVAGYERMLQARSGQVVLLDYWTTWCPPCKQEIPGFVTLHWRWKHRGLAVIGVSLDSDPEKAKRFVAEYEVPYPVYLASRDLRSHLKVGVIPTTVVYDRGGRERSRHVGYTAPEVFERELDALLGGPESP